MKAKQIIIDYNEYEEMVSLIKKQKEAINELKKDSRVILIDTRHDFNGCPKVIAGEQLAKEFLQKEFECLNQELSRMRHSLHKHRIEESREREKNSFWGFKIV